jgi:hypothetical protein
MNFFILSPNFLIILIFGQVLAHSFFNPILLTEILSTYFYLLIELNENLQTQLNFL